MTTPDLFSISNEYLRLSRIKQLLILKSREIAQYLFNNHQSILNGPIDDKHIINKLLLYKSLWDCLAFSDPKLGTPEINHPLPPYQAVIDFGAGDFKVYNDQYQKRFDHLIYLMDKWGFSVISPYYLNNINIEGQMKDLDDFSIFNDIKDPNLECLTYVNVFDAIIRRTGSNAKQYISDALQRTFRQIYSLRLPTYVLLHKLHALNKLEYLSLTFTKEFGPRSTSFMPSDEDFRIFINTLCNLWINNKMNDNTKNRQRCSLMTESIIRWRNGQNPSLLISTVNILNEHDVFAPKVFAFFVDFIKRFKIFVDTIDPETLFIFHQYNYFIHHRNDTCNNKSMSADQ